MSHCETGHSPRPGSGRGECLDLTVGREAPPPTGLAYFLMYTTIVDEIIPARCAAAASSPEKEL